MHRNLSGQEAVVFTNLFENTLHQAKKVSCAYATSTTTTVTSNITKLLTSLPNIVVNIMIMEIRNYI